MLMRSRINALMPLVLVVALFGSAAACNGFWNKSVKSLDVSGASLKAAGGSFIAIAGIYKHGCDVAKTISPAQCEKFRIFGEGFEKSYRPAVRAWDLASQASDSAAKGTAAATILQLSVGLAVLASDVIDLTKAVK